MQIEELKKGSQEAFAQLVEQYSRSVIGTCMSFVHNLEDAEDIAQEVFIEVYKSIRLFRRESDIKTWIYRIAINRCIDFTRKQNRKKRIADMKGLFLHKDKPQNTPHQQLEEQERKELLARQIALLPENQRIALVLSRYEKMSNQQIARIMKTSESAVESLLHRARKNLRKNLAKYFEKNL